MLTGELSDYGGISASRLEVLEERLRDDVVQELTSFGGRLVTLTFCLWSTLNLELYQTPPAHRDS